MVIEKRQRPVGRERRQPQRQPRELDGHRVQVDAVQAPLGNRPPRRHALALAEIAAVVRTGPDERRFVRLGQIAARGHQERAAAHRRIDDAELQDALGRRVAHQRAERAANEVVGDRLRRVERAGGFSNAGAADQPDREAIAACRRSVVLKPARFVVEQRFVHRAELLDAEVAVRDAFAPGAIGRRPRRQREHGARLAASSSRSRRSASGVRAGANRRPLNGVTRRSPARQPACARRAIARSASHSPTAVCGCSAAERSDSTL